MILAYLGIVFIALAVGSVMVLVFSEALGSLERRLKQWWKEDGGTTSVEYAIVLAVVAVTVCCAFAPLWAGLHSHVGSQAEQEHRF